MRSVEPPAGTPDWLVVSTATERPDLWQRATEQRLFERVWPEYNLRGTHARRYFGALFPKCADLQILFTDQRADRIVARGRTIPFHWDGTLQDLPAGIDSVGLSAIAEDREPTALSALSAEVDPDYQGRRLSGLLIKAMGSAARLASLRSLLAPVRPSAKHRYPLVPIERYVEWTRDDGSHFDPWLRVHLGLGGRILRPEPRSMQFTAPVEDWERWTGMWFPEDRHYVFPGGLAPLAIRNGVGEYYEPNVWVLHETACDSREY